MVDKKCFMDGERVCDLSCKAAFEVDDPLDRVDCYFIWLAHHFGEGLFELRENFGGGPGPAAGGGPPGHPGQPGVGGSGPSFGHPGGPSIN
ncbi:MAG: hypothetical protein QF724_05185 [Planctomycetota bacterium]|jgi:hypothetical protein|nr:hypothetical protein [Planctomycetota bacterium]MDP6369838.1 hypothetical protein [Planctomycetota bacterium]MDP6518335.1 hypothetical protein [Planctomycetota bacterium]MDP6838312.1 hypothetical protein [Planctomycetota bacterium]MDP6954545.1 hypothetical protein [Planctomycetota bacterium]